MTEEQHALFAGANIRHAVESLCMAADHLRWAGYKLTEESVLSAIADLEEAMRFCAPASDSNQTNRPRGA